MKERKPGFIRNVVFLRGEYHQVFMGLILWLQFINLIIGLIIK